MEIEDASLLIFQTYYMIDWEKTIQAPSSTKCVECGGEMMTVEPIRDKKGQVYNGRVCHGCRTLLWVKKD
jgi:hypothetical protein